MSAYSRKRTLIAGSGMSAKCQQQTLGPVGSCPLQKEHSRPWQNDTDFGKLLGLVSTFDRTGNCLAHIAMSVSLIGPFGVERFRKLLYSRLEQEPADAHQPIL